MASSVIKNMSGYKLLDSLTFTAMTTVTHTVTVDTTNIEEIAIMGGCISTSFPIIQGIASYSATGYYYVAETYNLRTFVDVTIVDANTISIRYRLEAKGTLEGYPTMSIYYR